MRPHPWKAWTIALHAALPACSTVAPVPESAPPAELTPASSPTPLFIVDLPGCIGHTHGRGRTGFSPVTVGGPPAFVQLSQGYRYTNFGPSPELWLEADERSDVPCHLRRVGPELGFEKTTLREERWLVPPQGGTLPPDGVSSTTVHARIQPGVGRMEVLVQDPERDHWMAPLGTEWTPVTVRGEAAWFLVTLPSGSYQFLVAPPAELTFVESPDGKLRLRWGSE